MPFPLSLTARGFIDTTAGSDHYGKFSVAANEVRHGIWVIYLTEFIGTSITASFFCYVAESIFFGQRYGNDIARNQSDGSEQ